MNFDNFVTALESARSSDGIYHFELEQENADGKWNTLINKTMEQQEIVDLYNSLSSTHEIDSDNTQSHPRFKIIQWT